MVTLQYRGRAPDSDAILVHKAYADPTVAAAALTTTWVNNQIATAITTMGWTGANANSVAYVDARDVLRAQKADVDAADALYIPATALNAASGVAGLGSDGNLISGQLPLSGVRTDRVAQCYSIGVSAGNQGVLGTPLSSVSGAVGSVVLSGAVSVSTATLRELQIASIPIPDPGYPWRALPMAWVSGNSSGGPTPTNRQFGNGDYGLLTVMPPSGVSNQIYGLGVATGSIVTDMYPVLPYAAVNQTPTSVAPINGALTLSLYGCCWSGNSYTFSPTNLVFFVLCLPAL